MFPTTHDITPEVLPDCLRFLRGLLEPGNRVLIVSKPHVDCIAAICEQLEAHRSQVLFRFTIGSDDDGILGYWEPGAPTFPERLASLQHAHGLGWETSVSIEPMLDAPNIVRLVDALEPFVTDSIWIGKMNDIGRRVAVETDADRRQVRRIERNQLDGAIRTVYESLRDRPVVKWKESIKDVVGIDRPQVAGLDI
jgi:DNA repair photolyase